MEWPGLVFFYAFTSPLVYSILINPSGNRFSFLFITMSSSRGCGSCGKLGRLLPGFPSAVGTVENMQFVFHGFQLRGSFHSLRFQKALSARLAQKTWGHILLPTSFSLPPNGMACALAVSFRLNQPAPPTPFWCANCVAQTSAHVRDEAIDQAWR